MKKASSYLFLVIVFCFTTGCWGDYEGRIRIDGSSSLFPLTEAVAEDFRSVYPEIKITVGVSGTGGGFKKFIRNDIDILNASRKLNKEDIEKCKKSGIEFIELPVSSDALVVAVNPENNFVDYLSTEELKKIWAPEAQGKIKYWDQVRVGWPHIPIVLFGAGPSSGSFDYFSLKIVGTKKAVRGDYTASEDDNMLVQGVSGIKGALGYFGLSYYLENKNKLKLVPIDDLRNDNGTGAYLPTEENIKTGMYQPLSRIEFLYINSKSAEKEIVKKFINYYLASAARLSKETGSIALQSDLYSDIMIRFNKQIKGTILNDDELLNVNTLHKELKN